MMPSVRRTRLMRSLWHLHRWIYRHSGGRIGGRLWRLPVLLLTTSGRRTGRPSTVALTYFREGTAFVVIGSNAGHRAHPGWILNLRADPRAVIQVGRLRVEAAAHEAQGPERERLWARIVQAEQSYARYQARTTRRIPVVLLQPEPDRGELPRLMPAGRA